MRKGVTVRGVCVADKEFWFSLDKHISPAEFDKKAEDKRGYVLFADGEPAGILRYNLFWDNTPFCTMLFVGEGYRRKGYGAELVDFWEKEMAAAGYDFVLTSTRADEEAQNFYRALGYRDCGSLILSGQPTEIFLCKNLR